MWKNQLLCYYIQTVLFCFINKVESEKVVWVDIGQIPVLNCIFFILIAYWK